MEEPGDCKAKTFFVVNNNKKGIIAKPVCINNLDGDWTDSNIIPFIVSLLFCLSLHTSDDSLNRSVKNSSVSDGYDT
jgi:hypothetical protein